MCGLFCLFHVIVWLYFSWMNVIFNDHKVVIISPLSLSSLSLLGVLPSSSRDGGLVSWGFLLSDVIYFIISLEIVVRPERRKIHGAQTLWREDEEETKIREASNDKSDTRRWSDFHGDQSLWSTTELLCDLFLFYINFEHLHEARSCSPQNPRIESKLEWKRDAYHQEVWVLLGLQLKVNLETNFKELRISRAHNSSWIRLLSSRRPMRLS